MGVIKWLIFCKGSAPHVSTVGKVKCFPTSLGTYAQQIMSLFVLSDMGVGRIFSRGGSRGISQNFSRGAKSGEICFLPLKIEKNNLFC